MPKIENATGTYRGKQYGRKEVYQPPGTNRLLVGLGGQNMVYSLIGASFFTYFMTDIALFPALVVSVLLIVMKVWDGVNDPIVGSFIDKHTFKNGEKLRPFLRYTPLPVGIFTVLLFVVFSTKEELLWLRVSYFVIMYICWDLAYTVQDVSIWGITAAVSPNSNERDRFVQWARTIGSCVYSAFSTVIPMALEMIANATGASMALMALVFALIFGLGGSMLSYRCYAAQERIHVVQEVQQQSLWESFSLLFKNKMLLLVTLANLLGALAWRQFGDLLLQVRDCRGLFGREQPDRRAGAVHHLLHYDRAAGLFRYAGGR